MKHDNFQPKLSIERILSALETRFDTENQCYIAEHAEWTAHIGCGETEEEARAEFEALLEDAWPYYEAGKHAMNRKKMGRPALGRVKITTKLNPEVRDRLKQEAGNLKISMGELIERLTLRYL